MLTVTGWFAFQDQQSMLISLNTSILFLFCCIDKPRTVKPLGRSLSRSLSFTQDGPAFSMKTARAETLPLVEIELYPRQYCFQHKNRPESTPSPAKVGNLQVDELAQLSRSAEHADLTRDAKPYTRRLLTHLIGPPLPPS